MVRLHPRPGSARGDGLNTSQTTVAGRRAVELHITGVVQGVGFRPFVHRLAMRHGLVGWCRNESGEVRIALEGSTGAIERFRSDLTAQAPPLASIDSLEVIDVELMGATRFEVMASESQPEGRLPVSPDVAICPACEAEFFDAQNRRHRYPFITCTDCGPRFTVIESMPYDRERTSMRAFQQCAECAAEYGSSSDRRYHSETNSCHRCGPRVWFVSPTGERVDDHDAILQAARYLHGGAILGLRGLGGFHLAVDATNEEAVSRLRERKSREAKPLAIMVKSVAAARLIGHVGTEEEALLHSRERPIVLLVAKDNCGLAPSVAPGLDTIGVMTAYTPLHLLLLDQIARPLVMTSGNMSDEPIAISNGEAIERLLGIADAFLLHDREIVSRYDDSVVRIANKSPLFLRRARGYAPLPFELPVRSPQPLLAVGPHLKNTFALVHGTAAYVSQHIGDLENLETLDHFKSSLDRFQSLFNIEPEIVVRDRHPGYLSTRVAEETGLQRVIAVQHHHAHIAAVAAEHGVTDPVIGVAYDGTGYGDDGCVWGAELMVADLADYERIGHLRYAPLPGGELAVRTPWRVALGYASLDSLAKEAIEGAFEGVSQRERVAAGAQIRSGLNAPQASSMGRLFDAAAAVLGVREITRYEGQAAMELEALAGRREVDPLVLPARRGDDGQWILDPVPLLVSLIEQRARGTDLGQLAAGFHEAVAHTTAAVVERISQERGLDIVCLGGGCFQNKRLLESVVAKLDKIGLRVLVPRLLSPNDGAISYGQAAIAAAVLRRELGG